jgi:hypothetical protein
MFLGFLVGLGFMIFPVSAEVFGKVSYYLQGFFHLIGIFIASVLGFFLATEGFKKISSNG